MTTPETRVDAVVVSYQSRESLRDCVEPLVEFPSVSVTVVDNASSDGSLDSVRDLPLAAVQSERNGGFAFGCNLGARRGTAPYLLFLNPDARIDEPTLARLVRVLDEESDVALVAPRIVEADGELAASQRHFPRLRSTFAQGLFLHRVFPRAAWTDELIRDPGAYERPGSPDWVSGACMLVRRSGFEAVAGFDEGYFLYCEDIDLCFSLREAGHDIRFEPAATVYHEGGASCPSSELRAVLTASRLRYARRRRGRLAALVEAIGIGLGEATHILSSVHRPSVARGHASALRALMRPTRRTLGVKGST